MIVQRLLRFALGRSYLDKSYDNETDVGHHIVQARKENEQKSSRIAQAETQVLNYIGLTKHNQFEKKPHDESDDEIGDVVLATAFHTFHSIANWPFYVVRAQIQTYRTASTTTSRPSYFDLFKGTLFIGDKFNYHRAWAGLLSSGVHEASAQAICEVLIRLIGDSWWIAPFASTICFPLLECSLKQVLGITPPVPHVPSLGKGIFTLGYWKKFSWVIVDNLVYDQINSFIKLYVTAVLTYGSVNNLRKEVRAQYVTRFAMSTLGDQLTDFLCTMVSSTMFRNIASLYYSGNVYGCNQLCDWRMLIKACAIEWGVSCLIAICYDHVYKWYVRDKVQ